MQRRFRVGDLVVDPGTATVWRGEERLALPGLSYDLLVVLARAAPNLVTHDELMARVWKGVVVSPETIGQRVKLLRDALGDDPREPRYVAGVRGRGYRLLHAAVPLEAPSPGAPAPAPGPVPVPVATPVAIPVAVPEAATVSRASSSAVAGDAHASPDGASSPHDAGASPPRSRSTLAASRPWSRPALAAVLIVVLALAAVAALVLRGGAPGPASPGTDARTTVDVTGAPPRSVAVLPFANLSPDPANAYVGLGLAETVLNRLASTGSLFVVARGSSFAYEGRDVDVREIGRELGVRYLVQGGVQREGERLRITAQLVDAETGRPVKALTFDRTMGDLFAVQDELAMQLAGALDVTLALRPAGTSNLAAELEYLQGLAAMGRWRVAETDAALRHFRAARRLDPNYAAPYVGEAKALGRREFLLGRADPDVGDAARPLVERALELDPQLPDAYVARAALARDPAAAERDLRRATELAPNDAEGWFALAELLEARGDRSAAIDLIERAVALDPLRPRYRYVLALLEQQTRRDDARYEAALREVLRIDPNYAQALGRLALVVSYTRGAYAEGIELAERAIAADPRARTPRYFAVDTYLAVGDTAAARDVVQGVPDPEPFEVAVALRRGDLDGVDAIVRRLAAAPADTPIATAVHGTVTTAAFLAAVQRYGLRSGDVSRAKTLIERHGCRLETGTPDCLALNSLGSALTIAALETASGSPERGADIARRSIALLDANPGYTVPIAKFARAKAQLLLGDTDAALATLEDAFGTSRLVHWWVLEHDATVDPIRRHPRYLALLEEPRRHAVEQRRLLEQLRQEGKVPLRPAR